MSIPKVRLKPCWFTQKQLVSYLLDNSNIANIAPDVVRLSDFTVQEEHCMQVVTDIVPSEVTAITDYLLGDFFMGPTRVIPLVQP